MFPALLWRALLAVFIITATVRACPENCDGWTGLETAVPVCGTVNGAGPALYDNRCELGVLLCKLGQTEAISDLNEVNEFMENLSDEILSGVLLDDSECPTPCPADCVGAQKDPVCDGNRTEHSNSCQLAKQLCDAGIISFPFNTDFSTYTAYTETVKAYLFVDGPCPELKIQDLHNVSTSGLTLSSADLSVNSQGIINGKCVLEDLGSIQAAVNDGDEFFQLELGSCILKIKADAITYNDDENTLDSGGDPSNCGAEAGRIKVLNNGDDITITTTTADQDCILTKVDSSGTKDIIDKAKIRTTRLYGRLYSNTVVPDDSDGYQVMDNGFVCSLSGAHGISDVQITAKANGEVQAVSDQGSFTVPSVNTNDKVEVSCTFTLTGNEIIDDTTFTLTRERVRKYRCGPGYRNHDGQCTACEPGTYKDEDVVNCTPCPHDEYVAYSGATSCTTCKGKLRDATTCEPCGPGEHWGSSSSSCLECKAGTFFNEGTSACEDCEEGNYSYGIGWKQCYPCEDGFQSNDDHKGCTPCEAGSAGTNGTCSRCPAGMFSSIRGQTECQDCPDGTVSDRGTKCTQDKTCEAENVQYDSIGGTYHFDRTIAGNTVTLECILNKEETATRVCNSAGYWETADFSNCNSKLTESIQDLEMENKQSIASLENITKDTDSIGVKDTTIVITKMYSVDDILMENNDAETISEVTDSTLKIMSSLLTSLNEGSELTYTQEVKNSIVNSTESFLSTRLQYDLSKEEYTLDTMNVLMKKISDSDPVSVSGVNVTVPSDSPLSSLALAVYGESASANLFKKPVGKNISGKVVSMKSKLKDGIKDYSFSFTLPSEAIDEDTDPDKKVRRECAWYSPNSNTWTTDGCKTDKTEDGSLLCTCNHMTSFAVILSVDENQTVEWLSDLVLAINIIFGILTLVCTLPFRTFRVREMTVLQSNSIFVLILLCICWYCMHIDFTGGGTGSMADSASCKAVAFIAHYLLISLFSWHFCCVIALKSKIVDAVKTFGKKRSIVKRSLIYAYGFPLLFPTLTLLISTIAESVLTKDGQVLEESSKELLQYIRPSECWYEDLWMYCLILFPIYLYLLFSLVTFVKIMRVVGTTRRSTEGSDRKIVKAGFALAITQGLPWIMHAGVLRGTGAQIFQYVFLVTFGLQGIGLFVFNVLFQEEVLKNLCRILQVSPPSIFLSVVPKQRRTPATGQTTLGPTCSGSRPNTSDNNTISNNLYQEHTFYNELHESSRPGSVASSCNTPGPVELNEKPRTDQLGSITTSNPKQMDENRVQKIIGNTRVYSTTPSVSDEQPRSPPMPGETVEEHKGPPFL